VGESPPHSTTASNDVLASILHNAKAYDVVASTKALTFNLDVFSDPAGATIDRRNQGEIDDLFGDGIFPNASEAV
jgi:hypothetical protein